MAGEVSTVRVGQKWRVKNSGDPISVLTEPVTFPNGRTLSVRVDTRYGERVVTTGYLNSYCRLIEEAS